MGSAGIFSRSRVRAFYPHIRRRETISSEHRILARKSPGHYDLGQLRSSPTPVSVHASTVLPRILHPIPALTSTLRSLLPFTIIPKRCRDGHKWISPPAVVLQPDRRGILGYPGVGPGDSTRTPAQTISYVSVIIVSQVSRGRYGIDLVPHHQTT